MTQEENRKLDEIYTLLVGLDGQPQTGFIGRTNTRLDEHDSRLGVVERWIWRIAGGCVVVGALLGFIAKVL